MRTVIAATLLCALACATAPSTAARRTASPGTPEDEWLRACLGEEDLAACRQLGLSDLRRGEYRRGAAALLAPCEAETPDGAACAALAALYAAGQGVPHDEPRAEALSKRAGGAAGPNALAPALPATAPSQAEREEARRWRKAYLELYLHQALRRELAIDAGRYVAEAPAGLEAHVVALTFLARTRQLRCGEPGAKTTARAFVSLTVAADGRPDDLRAAGDWLPASTAACLAEQARQWDLGGLLPPGNRYVMDVQVPVPRPPSLDDPAYATKGFTRPQLTSMSCILRSVRFPRGLSFPPTMTSRFAVQPDGRASHFEMMSLGVPPPVALEIKRAVESCKWIPGKDPQGKPVAIWVILPMRITSP